MKLHWGRWGEVLETELHLLLKYFCTIIPRPDQVTSQIKLVIVS